MKPIVYVVTCIAAFVSDAIAVAIVYWMAVNHHELGLIVGVIVGTHVAAIVHRRDPAAVSSAAVKARVGAILIVNTTVVAILAHAVLGMFPLPEISIPISAVASFVAPFVLFDTLWNAYAKANNR